MITFGLIAIFLFCFLYFAVFDRYDAWIPAFLAIVFGAILTVFISCFVPTIANCAPSQKINLLAGDTYAYLNSADEEIIVLLTDNESGLELFKTINVDKATIIYNDTKEPCFQEIHHEVENKLFFWGVNSTTEYVITIPPGTLTPLG